MPAEPSVLRRPTRPSVLRRTAAVLAALVAAVLLAVPPAAAGDRFLDIHGTAVCDHDHGEWVVTWTLTNRADVAGTLGNVRAYPAGRPLVGLPNRIQPGETITGEQRLLAWQYSGEILLDVNWDDGVVTYDHHWPVHIKVHCAA